MRCLALSAVGLRHSAPTGQQAAWVPWRGGAWPAAAALPYLGHQLWVAVQAGLRQVQPRLHLDQACSRGTREHQLSGEAEHTS